MTGRLMLASLALVLTVEVADPTGVREAAGFVEVAGKDREDTKFTWSLESEHLWKEVFNKLANVTKVDIVALAPKS